MEYQDQYEKALSTKYDCLLFDVDDTLYPLSSGLSQNCTRNILEYMVQKLGMEEKEVNKMNKVLYKNYGTSMAGLKAIGYNFDDDDYHSFVHGRLPYDNLKPDHVLRSLLLSLPIRKVIFSNGDRVHVAKVLSKLGLTDCFEKIICFQSLNPNTKNYDPKLLRQNNNNININVVPEIFENINYGGLGLPVTPVVCKPFENAFEQAFKIANINPQTTVFFDDSIRNIETAKLMGLHTVLVGSSQRKERVDYAIESIHNIKQVLPELWELANNKEDINKFISCKMALEKTITA